MKKLRALVPLDGSGLSEAVRPLLRDVAPSSVTLIRVLDPGAEDERLAAELDLERIAESLRAEGAAGVTWHTRPGKPVPEILRAARELDAGLIAMTTHGRSGFDRLVFGSVAESVIRASPVPVLAVRASEATVAAPPAGRLFDRVLVPYDGSERAWRAVEELALAGAAEKGARLAFLGVVESDVEAAAVISAPAPLDIATRYARLVLEGMRDALGHAAARARDLGFVDPVVELDVGRPAAKIVDRVERDGATLVAMGTHGRSGPTRWALGSVTEMVLRAAGVPVLVVRG